MSQVSCEPDVVQILDMSQPRPRQGGHDHRDVGHKVAAAPGQNSSAQPQMTTTTTIIDNRALTIQTFKLEPGMSLETLGQRGNGIFEILCPSKRFHYRGEEIYLLFYCFLYFNKPN